MKFEQALQAMREGKGAKRNAWKYEIDNPVNFVRLGKHESSDICNICYTYTSTAVRGSHHFKLRVTDLLAEDWVIVGGEQPEQKNYLSEAMSQSADKIKECAQKRTEQALKEVSEQQDEEIVKKAKLRNYIESIGISSEEIQSKLIHPDTFFGVINGEFEKIKVRGVQEIAKSRGYYGNFDLPFEMAIKALIVFLCEICDDKQKQIDDLKNRVGELTAKIDRLHHRLIGGEQDGV